MSETGKTEEEIRAIYKYRKMLSEAAKVKTTDEEAKWKKYYKQLIKLACRRSLCWPSHPDTLEELKKLLPYRSSRYNNLTFEQIVKRYINP